MYGVGVGGEYMQMCECFNWYIMHMLLLMLFCWRRNLCSLCVGVYMGVCCLLYVQIEFLSAGYEEESIKSIVNNNMHLIVDRVLRVWHSVLSLRGEGEG